MSSQNQRKIKNFLINPKFQSKYILWTSGTGFLLIAINAVVFYRFMKENYAILIDLSPMTDAAKNQLNSELNTVVMIMVAFSCIFFVLTTIFGLIFSHKVAGPMYKMKKTFEEISKGNKDLRVRFRPNDEFLDLADTCNKMLDSLTEKK